MARAGELTFDVDADGNVLERSLRRIGKAAGISGANEFETSFGRRFEQSGGKFTTAAERMGERIGNALSAGMRKIGGPIGRLADRLDNVTTRLDHFNRTASRPHIFSDLSNLLAKGANSLDGFGDGADRAGASFKKLGDDSGDSGRLIQSHIGRVIALWATLILAIGQGTAALGSGVGATLTAVIGSIAVALVGALGLAGAALAGFAVQVTLAVAALQQMKDVVPGFQGALDNLSAAWSNAGRVVAEIWGPSVMGFLGQVTNMLNNPALLEGMGKSLSVITDAFTAILQGPGFTALMSALETTIPAALGTLGTGFSSVFGGLASIFAAAAPTLQVFADQFAAWAGNFADTMATLAADGTLQRFFELALESINSVMGVTSSLGGALLTLFQAAAPYGNIILDIIADLLDDWNEWMQTVGGENALQEWFEQGVTIFEALLPLIGALGQMFADLVTPESVERLVSFIDGLAEFLPTIGQILDLFGRLDVLNIFVGILGLITDLLTPVMPVLLELADVIGTQLVAAFELWSPSIAKIGEALVPVLIILGNLIAGALPGLIAIVTSVLDYLAKFVESFVATGDSSDDFTERAKAMGDAVNVVFTLIAGVIDTVLTVAGGLLLATGKIMQGDFAGAADAMGSMIHDIFAGLGIDIDEVINWFEDLFREGGNFMRDLGNVLGDFGSTVADVFGGVIGWLSDATDWFWSLFGAANSASSAVTGAQSAGGGGSGGALMQATGGLHTQMRHVIVGEAGPEAIVPLRRNLNQVDPAVRWLSAIAQGKYAMGGVVGAQGGSGMVVSPGAIVVQEAADGRRTANDVLTRLAEFANG